MSKNLEYIWWIYMYIVNTIAMNNQQYLNLFCKDVSYAHVSRSLVLIQKIIHTKNSEKWINLAFINKKVPTIHTGILCNDISQNRKIAGHRTIMYGVSLDPSHIAEC